MSTACCGKQLCTCRNDFYTYFYSTADIESLLTSPLSSALPLVLKLCANEDEDIFLVALDIIGLLVENGNSYVIGVKCRIHVW